MTQWRFIITAAVCCAATKDNSENTASLDHGAYLHFWHHALTSILTLHRSVAYQRFCNRRGSVEEVKGEQGQGQELWGLLGDECNGQRAPCGPGRPPAMFLRSTYPRPLWHLKLTFAVFWSDHHLFPWYTTNNNSRMTLLTKWKRQSMQAVQNNYSILKSSNNRRNRSAIVGTTHQFHITSPLNRELHTVSTDISIIKSLFCHSNSAITLKLRTKMCKCNWLKLSNVTYQ